MTSSIYEITVSQFGLEKDRKAELFVHVNNGSSTIFFIHNEKEEELYEKGREVILS